MGVKRSAYRQPVTADGLKAIEDGTLTWLDQDMYKNLNTGLLEQYLEEKNLEEAFEVSHWSLGKVIIGILIGAVFSGVTAYIGLKIGLAVSAAWYIAYLFGMAMRWSPSEVNIATSATTGATHASTGFIFTFPAIFLLASSPNYEVAGGHLINNVDTFQLAFIGIIASMFAGFLGVMYFIIFRRVWLVEDPLPMPGFEATLVLLDIACDVSTGAAEQAKESLATVGLSTVATMVFMFLIDYPLSWKRHMDGVSASIMDVIAQKLSFAKTGFASIFSHHAVHQPAGVETVVGEHGTWEGVSKGVTYYEEGSLNPFMYTYLGVELSPTLFAIGWFMRLRVAVLVNLGTLVAWFYLVPLAVMLDVPVYIASMGDYYLLSDIGDPSTQPYSPFVQMTVYGTLIRVVAIGAILGGGFLGLVKMAPTFVGIFGDIRKAFRGEQGEEYIEGKGWYEWPLYHLPIFILIAFVAMSVIFWIGGFPLIPSILFAFIVGIATFLLGAIAVRVMGETGIEPVSGTSFIVLLGLLGLFLNMRDTLGLSKEEAILMGLVGTTVFGSAISMSGTVVGDYKNSLYIGNRPYHISKGNIMGVVPGAILGAGVAIFLSMMLASGKIDLLAPQANAFATFTILLAENEGNMQALGLGFALGCFVEWATGMGTSFGLGMYLPTLATFPMLIGGGFRDWWEAKRLKPKVEKIREKEGNKEAERARAIMLLGTFMLAAGMLTGEAFLGVESAIFAVVDELPTGDLVELTSDGAPVFGPDGQPLMEKVVMGDLSWYPYARFGAFVMLNVLLAGAIYGLFRKAGIIGPKDQLMEAELG
jgi:uncharacterized oligopeptide transporter (OPT) family protein